MFTTEIIGEAKFHFMLPAVGDKEDRDPDNKDFQGRSQKNKLNPGNHTGKRNCPQCSILVLISLLYELCSVRSLDLEIHHNE